MSQLRRPRGVPDILPPRSELQEAIVRSAEDLFKRYGYRRIDLPVFEHTEVFERGLDSQSEVVTKQMYTFEDKGGRSVSLRPDGTAPVMRAILEHGLHRSGLPLKLYYTGQIFRHESPQAARQRQFTQVGVEAVGSEGPEIDAEVILLATALYRMWGLDDAGLRLNSIGHPECRALYLPKLVAYLEEQAEHLSEESRRRTETNPLRVFDSKHQGDLAALRNAPLITESLCAACADHFAALQSLLEDFGVEFEVDGALVRGLDYYWRTAFEFYSPHLGAQDAVGAGGRYDGLSESLGGPPLPGVGFALGVDRIALAREAKQPFEPEALQVFVVHAGRSEHRSALLLAQQLRAEGFSVDLDFMGRSVKAQFKAADRAGARVVVVLGERERAAGTVTVRDMTSGAESQVPEGELGAHLEAALSRRGDA